MSDRLAELSRQRALVQEHLAWLDREIARARSEKPAARDSGLPAAPAHPPIGGASNPAVATGAADSPDTLLEEYRVPPEALRQDLRKGCLLYFVGAFVLLGLVVAALYFTIGSRR